MKELIITEIGSSHNLKTGKEKGTITFNDGALTIYVDADEVLKLAAYMNNTPTPILPIPKKVPEEEDQFYIPNVVLDTELETNQQYEQEEHEDSFSDDDSLEPLDEDGVPSY